MTARLIGGVDNGRPGIAGTPKRRRLTVRAPNRGVELRRVRLIRTFYAIDCGEKQQTSHGVMVAQSLIASPTGTALDGLQRAVDDRSAAVLADSAESRHHWRARWLPVIWASRTHRQGWRTLASSRPGRRLALLRPLVDDYGSNLRFDCVMVVGSQDGRRQNSLST